MRTIRTIDVDDVDARIVRPRGMNGEIDAVMRAPAWQYLDLGHGCRGQPNLAENARIRFTISDAADAEVRRSLAELNRDRYYEEQGVPSATVRSAKRRVKAAPAGQSALALVDTPAPKTSKTKAAAPAKKTSTGRPR